MPRQLGPVLRDKVDIQFKADRTACDGATNANTGLTPPLTVSCEIRPREGGASTLFPLSSRNITQFTFKRKIFENPRRVPRVIKHRDGRQWNEINEIHNRLPYDTTFITFTGEVTE